MARSWTKIVILTVVLGLLLLILYYGLMQPFYYKRDTNIVWDAIEAYQADNRGRVPMRVADLKQYLPNKQLLDNILSKEQNCEPRDWQVSAKPNPGVKGAIYYTAVDENTWVIHCYWKDADEQWAQFSNSPPYDDRGRVN